MKSSTFSRMGREEFPLVTFIVFCGLIILVALSLRDLSTPVPARMRMQQRFPVVSAYHGCGPHGDASPGSVEWELNVWKNRSLLSPLPTPNPSITLSAILAGGGDSARFQNTDFASVQGYVAEVKRGSIESCNCRTTDGKYQDTHIALVPTIADLPNQRKRVVVEVTPRGRSLHVDWTTSKLHSELSGHLVKVDGWMFADTKHLQNAANTNPGGTRIWRATIWEIHPVTSIQVLK